MASRGWGSPQDNFNCIDPATRPAGQHVRPERLRRQRLGRHVLHQHVEDHRRRRHGRLHAGRPVSRRLLRRHQPSAPQRSGGLPVGAVEMDVPRPARGPAPQSLYARPRLVFPQRPGLHRHGLPRGGRQHRHRPADRHLPAIHLRRHLAQDRQHGLGERQHPSASRRHGEEPRQVRAAVLWPACPPAPRCR